MKHVQRAATEVCGTGSVRDVNPQEFHDEADHNIGAEEEDSVENRGEQMNPAVQGLQEQPEKLGGECSTRSIDEEKGCGFEVVSELMEGVRGRELGADEVGSDLLEVVRGWELGADVADRAESWSKPIRKTLDKHDADSKNKEQKESGALMGHTLQILQLFSDAIRLVGQAAKQGRWTTGVPP